MIILNIQQTLRNVCDESNHRLPNEIPNCNTLYVTCTYFMVSQTDRQTDYMLKITKNKDISQGLLNIQNDHMVFKLLEFKTVVFSEILHKRFSLMGHYANIRFNSYDM